MTGVGGGALTVGGVDGVVVAGAGSTLDTEPDCDGGVEGEGVLCAAPTPVALEEIGVVGPSAAATELVRLLRRLRSTSFAEELRDAVADVKPVLPLSLFPVM